MKKPAIKWVDRPDLSFGFPGKMPRIRNEKDKPKLAQFFLEYLKDGSALLAARRAGFSDKWGRTYSYRYLKENADYVKWLQAHAAQQAAKQIVIDQDAVLQEIARIGMVNEYDYLVIDTTPEGKIRVRRKHLSELTREQMTAIRVTDRNGVLNYELRDKEGKLTELARHLGMLNEKILLERRHLHLHAKLDFSKVPMEKLEAIEVEFEEIFEQAGAMKRLAAK